MKKIKVIKSGKETAKPSNFCPWVVDDLGFDPNQKK